MRREPVVPPLFARILSFLSIFCFCVAVTCQYRNWHLEDGYIIYRVVEHIRDGLGWAFNPGEIRNASTSTLNTVLGVVLAKIGFDIPWALHLVGAFSLLAAGLTLERLLRSKVGLAISTAASLLLVSRLSGSSTWGLEVFLFIALALRIVESELFGRSTWSTLALLTLARPDGLLMVGFKSGFDILKGKLSALPRGLLTYGLWLAPWLIFSLYVFHQPFPDTLKQKMWQGASGFWGYGAVYLTELGKHLLQLPLWMKVADGIGALTLFICACRLHPLGLLGLFALFQQAAYVLLNVPGYHWYFVTLDAFLLIGAMYGVASVFEFIASRSILRRCNSTLATLLIFIGSSWWGYSAVHDQQAQSGNMHYLNAIKAMASMPAGSLATLEVGTLGYFSKRPIVDLTGLTSTNPEYMSGKYLAQYFANPAELVLVHDPMWRMDQALLTDPRFVSWYDQDYTYIDGPSQPLRIYRRRSAPLPLPQIETVPTKAELVAMPAGSSCTIDTANGPTAEAGYLHAAGDYLTLTGWALLGTVPDQRDVTIEVGVFNDTDSWVVKTSKLNRPDVAKALSNPLAVQTGFSGLFDAHALPPGAYSIGVRMRKKNEVAGFYCVASQKLLWNVTEQNSFYLKENRAHHWLFSVLARTPRS